MADGSLASAAATTGDAWVPQAEGLEQLLNLLRTAQHADNQTHRTIQQQLLSFNAIPDYNCYLSFIFNEYRQEPSPLTPPYLTLPHPTPP